MGQVEEGVGQVGGEGWGRWGRIPRDLDSGVIMEGWYEDNFPP